MTQPFNIVTSCSGALLEITDGTLHQINESFVDDFVRGFLDAYFGRLYSDGIYPSHRFEVCVPTGDAYRNGWFAGKLASLSGK